ncbi:putative Histidine kinase [Candidatus Terasakiella magnetica]|uniref:histidine kinase n=1 Tax=Candidatus Terasakiella magnetica TaxID=1867952 RepID=A0A1C3RHZ6_9PROT|nr:ATP-binding protein [Candidatus Terasakiella magnetica]SCA56903.1 putative Histidine kinase [Candidatus Terasakiella magnetica]
MGNRLLFIILAIGIIAVGGTWLIVQKSTETILQEQARSESLHWAQFVQRDLTDLPRLLYGAPPTIEDMRTLGTAKNVGNVYSFQIYADDATVVWSGDYQKIGDENREDYFIAKVMRGQKHVRILRLEHENRVIADAFLPIMKDGNFLGAIEVSLDLTHLAQDTQRMAVTLTSGIASLFVILLLITSLIARYEIGKERKLKAKALQAAKARNDFIALVSHELRTPLNGILGALGLVSESKNEDEKTQLTQTAIHSTEHLIDIINDIIDFTQATGRRESLNPETINLSNFASEIEIMFKVDATNKGLDYHVNRIFTEGCHGEIDLKKLRQIMFNLVSNAVKFTDKGKVDVHMEVTSSPERKLICHIKDTGLGLSQEDQADIFERFHQVDDPMSRQHGGIGLGLSLCKEFAELMNGSLSVQSELGKGSTFYLELPFSTSDAEVENSTITPLQDVGALNLLLTEDNAINQKVLMTILKHAGHTVTIAENGQRCLEVTQDQHFDLILMDIQMPLMTGEEATIAIRNGTGPNKDTPIIAISANIMPQQQESYLKAGMQGCLAKPIKPQDLRQAVSRYYQEFGTQ